MNEESRKLLVFVSYASEDKIQVLELIQKLKNDGFDVWFDREKLQGGQNWKAEIERAIIVADVSIICLSKSGVQKIGYFQKEIKKLIDRAEEHSEENIFLIPVRLDEVDVPHSLESFQWINYFENDGYKRLTEALTLKTQQLGKAAATPQQNTKPTDITGTYIATGNNDDGSGYSGKVIISKRKKSYVVKWFIAGDEFEAKGGLSGNVLAVHGDYTVIYQVQPDGTLFGKWSGSGTETLSPAPPGF